MARHIQVKKLPGVKMRVAEIEFEIEKRGAYFFARWGLLWVSGGTEAEAATLLKHEILAAFEFYRAAALAGGLPDSLLPRLQAMNAILETDEQPIDRRARAKKR